MKYGIVALFAVCISGCAQTPESIAPSYVSPNQYMAFSCSQLTQEAYRVDVALHQASAQQNRARTNDTVGVILLGLPVSSLSGGNVAEQVASLKGQRQTLEQTRIAKSCG